MCRIPTNRGQKHRTVLLEMTPASAGEAASSQRGRDGSMRSSVSRALRAQASAKTHGHRRTPTNTEEHRRTTRRRSGLGTSGVRGDLPAVASHGRCSSPLWIHFSQKNLKNLIQSLTFLTLMCTGKNLKELVSVCRRGSTSEMTPASAGEAGRRPSGVQGGVKGSQS